MGSVEALLREKLRSAKNVVVLGVGSTLRADDGAGMRIVQRLAPRFEGDPHLLFCGGETAPENFTGKIKAFGPSLMIVVDACDVGAAPGQMAAIPHETVGGPGFCSHMLPIKVMIDYLIHETGTQAVLLGLQYKTLAFDGPMSTEMEEAVEGFCQLLENLLQESRQGGKVRLGAAAPKTPLRASP